MDALLVVLNEVRDTSPNCKYHTLDEEHIILLHGVPGAFELLLLLRYKRHGNILKLDKQRRDLALIWMAISSLEISFLGSYSRFSSNSGNFNSYDDTGSSRSSSSETSDSTFFNKIFGFSFNYRFTFLCFDLF